MGPHIFLLNTAYLHEATHIPAEYSLPTGVTHIPAEYSLPTGGHTYSC